jgi:hypothetical protein
MSTATITEPSIETSTATDRLTEAPEQKLSHPATSPDFDLHAETSEVLKDIGLTTSDAGGKLTFYGSDPILPSPMRFGTLAAVMRPISSSTESVQLIRVFSKRSI